MAANYLKKKEKNFSQPKGSIESLFQRLGWKRPLRARYTIDAWMEFCEKLKARKAGLAESLLQSSSAQKLNDKSELVIKLKSASLANELQFYKKGFLIEFNKLLAKKSQDAIKDLVFELN